MRFGGTLTLNGLVMYIATNLDKVLLGRFWGTEALGIYGRAYQLINIPSDNLNSAAGGVAFAALSRIQEDTARFKSYFLKGYSLTLSLTVPITFTCALFADDIIMVFLGPKWKSAALIFRMLAPTTLTFAVLNPLGWLLSSLGLVGRGLKMALVFGPALILGYLLGLPYGPKGVAFSYSVVSIAIVIPLIAWAARGTPISLRDLLLVISQPLFSGAVAAALGFGLHLIYGPMLHPLPRLALGVGIVVLAYVGVLFYAMGQKAFYLDLFRAFITPVKVEDQIPVSA
jgi:PST family polysaccharide transporter